MQKSNKIFWKKKLSIIYWKKKPNQILTVKKNINKFYKDGKTNIAYNCIKKIY